MGNESMEVVLVTALRVITAPYDPQVCSRQALDDKGV
jgi:hypothetical protein